MFRYNKKYNYTTVVFLGTVLLCIALYLAYSGRGLDSMRQDFYEVPLHQPQYTSITHTDLVLMIDSIFSTTDGILAANRFVVGALAFTLLGFAVYSMMLNSKILLQKGKLTLTSEIASLFTLEVDSGGNIIQANDKLISELGYTKEEFGNMNVRDIFVSGYAPVNPEHSDTNSDMLDSTIKTKQGKVMYILWKTIETPSGTIEYLGSDISQLKEFKDQINYITHHDLLTNLKNKTKLESHVTQLMAEKDKKFAFVYLDLDNFKHINETFGYSLGDEIVIELVTRIVKVCDSLNAGNIEIFRILGDEFALIYDNYNDISDVGDFSNLIMQSINQEYQCHSYNLNITASIGISCYPVDAQNYSDLYKSSEIAMNNAKELGRHRISFFNQYMKKELEFMVFALHDMKVALENKEYLLYYQPQYDIGTGKIRGFESLMRWISPSRGFVSPGEFIPYAEKSGLIKQLGQWALEEACTFANKIRSLGYEGVTVGVNVSTIQVLDDNFVKDVLHIIEKTGVDVRDIYLELTESILLETTDQNLAKIKDLNDAGVVFALDDFGTGYSSLTYLRKLPFSILKLDKSFVDSIASDAEQDEGTRKIVEAMIDLSHNINLEVVAEGVEQDIQLKWLKERNCDMCQGYLTGRPMPENDAFSCLENLGNIYDKK